MKKRFFFIFFPLLFVICNNALASDRRNIFSSLRKDEPQQGKVEINQPNDLEQLMFAYISFNSKKTGIEGYRVQVYSETGGTRARQGAENARTRLLSEFPSEKISLEYDEPYWKVRVGYFRNKHEAIPFVYRLRATFPGAHVVRSANIKPELF